MKWLIMTTVIVFSTTAYADSLNLLGSSGNRTNTNGNAWNLLETEKQSRERQSAERYEYQQRSPYNHITGAPLGGYPEKLGSPAPCGTLSPGYTRNKCE